ncbi:MAG: MmgE/PrpD family protein [Pseudomonadota bacterium]|nr:MmgE/PrpD family protein [Pseudomonadota bacterium]
MMITQTETLAQFATELNFDAIPPEIVERTIDCIIDTIAACTFGSELPWSKIVINHALAASKPGKASIFGPEGHKITPAMASLANGTLSHSFELDNLRMPSVGIHPGASLVPCAFSFGQEQGVSGKDLITAFTAGIEVLSRIGQSSNHSCEDIGFHNPGINGCFGAAMAAGWLLGLDQKQMTNALGIAGSLCSGLLEFAASGTGGMVKRLHLGRTSESGALAATLAKDGFTGPSTILEGKFGWTNVFCRDADQSKLTADLGKQWDASHIVFKRFACHITSHTPIQGILDVQAEHGLKPSDVAEILIQGNKKCVTHHDITEPSDVMLGQYSNNFCIALALFKDPMDPRNFSQENIDNPEIREICRKVKIEELPDTEKFGYNYGSRITISLTDGRKLRHNAPSFTGLPTDPLDREGLWQKFSKLCYRLGDNEAERLFDQLCNIENIEDISTINLTGAM